MRKYFNIAIALFVLMGQAPGVTAGPIADVLVVNGRTWAQVDLFENLSWNDMNAVCPGGVCGAGQLNGYDMAGWRWASLSDIQSLFTHYIGAPIAGFSVEQAFSTWAPAFFADGWRPTASFMVGQLVTRGALFTEDGFKYVQAGMIDYDEPVILATQGTIRNDQANVFRRDLRDIATDADGGWFYQAPEPSTILLFSISLLALAATHKRRISSATDS